MNARSHGTLNDSKRPRTHRRGRISHKISTFRQLYKFPHPFRHFATPSGQVNHHITLPRHPCHVNHHITLPRHHCHVNHHITSATSNRPRHPPCHVNHHITLQRRPATSHLPRLPASAVLLAFKAALLLCILYGKLFSGRYIRLCHQQIFNILINKYLETCRWQGGIYSVPSAILHFLDT